MRESQPSPGDERQDPFLKLAFGLWSPFMALGAQWNSRVVEQCASLSGEWQAFVERRLKQDLKLGQHLAAAKDQEEIWDLCVDFWQRARDEYAHEYALLSKLTGQVLVTGIEAAQRTPAKAALLKQ